jgi:flagellar motor protein MotB
MEAKKPSFGDDSLRKLNGIIFDYNFSLSSIAASKGNYTQASDYLSELLKSDAESTLVFDLQAKIAAQQGKLREAEFLWKKCLKAEPDNSEFIAALNRINKVLGSKPVKFYYLLNFLKALSVLLLVLILLIVYVFERVDQKQQMTFLKGQNEAMFLKVENLLNLKSNHYEVLLSISEKMRIIEGITVESKNNEITICFNEGLFNNGDNIKSSQKSTLNLISQTLSPYAGQIIVKVIGSTDGTPISVSNRFKNNDDLSISRSKVVFDRIYEFSRIPREDLMISSLCESNTKFPNDTQESRLKNRTVIIKISPKF